MVVVIVIIIVIDVDVVADVIIISIIIIIMVAEPWHTESPTGVFPSYGTRFRIDVEGLDLIATNR